MSGSDALFARERPAAGAPAGALVLIHGRGADERDLLPLADELDPERRLHVLAPRGPLALPPGGAHWYALGGIPTPDAKTFVPTYRTLTAWLDALAEAIGVPWERTVLGGFSQGAVMSYAAGLGPGRPRPAGLLALSGFLPEVPGLRLTPQERPGLAVAIGHGTYDPIIPVQFGRRAAERLAADGLEVTFRESPIDHAVDPAYLAELRGWLTSAVGARALDG
ncbi:MAG: phospholipase [Solirubrobacterales bacterium]|nr:phospholipase [Solirubrobacterales bacterium]